MSYIIADSGSTKTEWCIVGEEGKCETLYTSGINPVLLSKEEITQLLKKEFTAHFEEVGKIFFYGAGCAFADKNQYVKEALAEFFQASEVEVASDMMAAARSLCQHTSGIACIIGTGSNSCFYDGNRIVKNVPPLGFILGDEGSGAVLGKKLLADLLKGVLSAEVSGLFFKEYPSYNYGELINRVYRQPWPNRFMASLTKFMSKYIHYPEIEKIVTDSFGQFIERNVLQYEHVNQYPICFTGSVAFYFKPQLVEQLHKYGLTAGPFSQAPMEGLRTFHRDNK